MTHLHTSPSANAQPAAEPRATFESLLEPILPRAYVAARCLAASAVDAEDLVQEAVLLAYRGFHTFEPGTNFKAWFLKVLTNTFYMKCRHDRRRPSAISLDQTPELYLYSKIGAASAAVDANPAEAFLDRLETDQVLAAIEALPSEFRVVATLYFLEDLPYHEIASILGCPVGTVRSRLHRGRRLLQAALWHVAQDHGLGGPRPAA